MVLHGVYPADVRVAREVRAAVDAGFEVEVVATRGAGEARRERIDGVTVHRLPVTRKRGSNPVRFFSEYVLFTALATFAVARVALTRRLNVVQVHNPPDFLIVAALVPRLLGARVVLDVHDLASDMFLMRFGERPGVGVAERMLHWIERTACRFADEVVTVHEPYREELIRRGVDPARITVVLNSVDDAVLPPDPRPPQADPFRIVYHGTVTAHYGLELVVEAFALLPEDATLEIYGWGDAVPELRKRAAELGVATRIEISGVALPQADVLRRVEGAPVGVIPNLPTKLNQFALSTKLFEYVALGIPVVAADLPTLRAHFSDSEVAFFRAGDAASLAETLAALAGDYAAALARAGAARARYREEYAWQLQASRYTRRLAALATS
jgi:glycosyltransferase involved in cell wall biosynthesis